MLKIKKTLFLEMIFYIFPLSKLIAYNLNIVYYGGVILRKEVINMIELNDKTFDDALKNNETVVVDFWATWCGPCRALGPIVENVSEKHSNVCFAKVDVDDNPELCQKFNITSIPFVAKFKNGQLVDSFLGLRDEAFVEDFFTKE